MGFQRSALPKEGCNQGRPEKGLGRCVSTLSPPEGGLQQKTERSKTGISCFNAQPSRRRAATEVPEASDTPSMMFQRSALPKEGCNVMAKPSIRSPMFQRSALPKEGCNLDEGGLQRPQALDWPGRRSFNAQPSRRRAATGSKGKEMRRVTVSTLSPPEGGLQHIFSTPFGSNRCFNAQPSRRRAATAAHCFNVWYVAGFNAQPSRRRAATTGCWCPWRTALFQRSALPKEGCNTTPGPRDSLPQVSTLSPPEGGLQPRSASEGSTSEFQRSALPKEGCNTRAPDPVLRRLRVSTLSPPEGGLQLAPTVSASLMLRFQRSALPKEGCNG